DLSDAVASDDLSGGERSLPGNRFRFLDGCANSQFTLSMGQQGFQLGADFSVIAMSGQPSASIRQGYGAGRLEKRVQQRHLLLSPCLILLRWRRPASGVNVMALDAGGGSSK